MIDRPAAAGATCLFWTGPMQVGRAGRVTAEPVQLSCELV